MLLFMLNCIPGSPGAEHCRILIESCHSGKRASTVSDHRSMEIEGHGGGEAEDNGIQIYIYIYIYIYLCLLIYIYIYIYIFIFCFVGGHLPNRQHNHLCKAYMPPPALNKNKKQAKQPNPRGAR